MGRPARSGAAAARRRAMRTSSQTRLGSESEVDEYEDTDVLTDLREDLTDLPRSPIFSSRYDHPMIAIARRNLRGSAEVNELSMIARTMPRMTASRTESESEESDDSDDSDDSDVAGDTARRS